MSAKRLLGVDGKRLLSDDGKLMLSNSAGENCCCTPAEPCIRCLTGTTPKTAIVTISGVNGCGCCLFDLGIPGGYKAYIYDVVNLNGTWTLTQQGNMSDSAKCTYQYIISNAFKMTSCFIPGCTNCPAESFHNASLLLTFGASGISFQIERMNPTGGVQSNSIRNWSATAPYDCRPLSLSANFGSACCTATGLSALSGSFMKDGSVTITI